jgi:hypothetical protein
LCIYKMCGQRALVVGVGELNESVARSRALRLLNKKSLQIEVELFIMDIVDRYL